MSYKTMGIKRSEWEKMTQEEKDKAKRDYLNRMSEKYQKISEKETLTTHRENMEGDKDADPDENGNQENTGVKSDEIQENNKGNSSRIVITRYPRISNRAACLIIFIYWKLLSIHMNSENSKKHKIEAVKEEILKDKNSRFWKDFTNALNLISQVVFTRSSGFILEFIQNAEDAKGTQNIEGMIRIAFGSNYIKITHNGRPFDDNDVEAICGIRSSKKPETGTLGYLGIGFKSVFKVSDSPQIYSNGYAFKFDKNYQAWKETEDFPWGVTPIWIDEPPDDLEENQTTFIIPIKSSVDLSSIKSEVKKLSPEIFLYLKWIKKIVIYDEETKSERVLRNLGESEGIVKFQDGKETRSYVTFNREISVPEEVASDPLTQQFRRNVKKRVISIAFYVDQSGNLSKAPPGTFMGGLYSFVPINEVSSGAKFLIQADFLVQPGRDALNYEAKWNQWLVSEISALVWDAVKSFKTNPKWKFQFYRVCQFDHNEGTEAYEKLFKHFLIEVLEKKLSEDKCIISADNEGTTPENIYTTDEDPEAINSLSVLGLCEKGKEAEFLSGKEGAKFLHPKSLEFLDEKLFNMLKGNHPKYVTLQDLKRLDNGLFQRVNRLNLLNDDERLTQLWSDRNHHELFAKLYTWLKINPLYYYKFYYSWHPEQEKYYDYKLIPDRSGQLKEGRSVYFMGPELINSLEEDVLSLIEAKYSLINQNILKHLEGDKDLINFLKDSMGLKVLNLEEVYLEIMIPKIKVESTPPDSKDELLNITVSASNILQNYSGTLPKIYVLCKDGIFRHSDEVIFSKEYNIKPGWEENHKYVPSLHFLSPEYLERGSDESSRKRLIDFLKNAGVKVSPEAGVEEFAMNYCQNYLVTNKSRFKISNIQDEHARNYGYDLDGTKEDGQSVKIEVKGLSSESDITLTENETNAADIYKDNYYVMVISNIPSSPEVHILKNPSYHGKKNIIILPTDLWKFQSDSL